MRSSSEAQVRASTQAPPQPPRKLSLTFCLGPRCSCAAREGSLEAQPRHRQAWLALAAASLKLPLPLCICTKQRKRCRCAPRCLPHPCRAFRQGLCCSCAHAMAVWRRSRGTGKLGSRSRCVTQAAAATLHLHKTGTNAAAARRNAHRIIAGPVSRRVAEFGAQGCPSGWRRLHEAAAAQHPR